MFSRSSVPLLPTLALLLAPGLAAAQQDGVGSSEAYIDQANATNESNIGQTGAEHFAAIGQGRFDFYSDTPFDPDFYAGAGTATNNRARQIQRGGY